MIKTLLSIICAFVTLQLSHAQSIQNIIDQVEISNLELMVAQLSGEEDAIINGTLQTIVSRVQSNNDLAADYIAERLSVLPNLTVEVQEFNIVGKNIIATQLGQTNPDDI
jgi:hypothetical protein